MAVGQGTPQCRGLVWEPLVGVAAPFECPSKLSLPVDGCTPRDSGDNSDSMVFSGGSPARPDSKSPSHSPRRCLPVEGGPA